MAENADFIVIGGGIVGLASAYALVRARPSARIVLIEKEACIGHHQSGRNSGVIHAGVYYEPGSQKARFCRAGLKATLAFCRQHEVPYAQCGKLIVATNQIELERLRTLQTRAVSNGVEVEWMDAAELKVCEPNVTGAAALKVPETGMVDYRIVTARLGELLEQAGVELALNTEVTAIHEFQDRIEVDTPARSFVGARLVVCAGLYSDRLAVLGGIVPDFAIVPFRGDYFRLAKRFDTLAGHHIYPVPDPALPFLGIHLTRLIGGGISVGPSAMVAFSREGYRSRDVCVQDINEMLRFPGFWRVLARHGRAGFAELRCAASRSYYLKQVQKYCPQVTQADLEPHPSGVRAQAVARDGRLIHDFLIQQTARGIYVCNAPSPAATAALPIADEIVRRVLD